MSADTNFWKDAYKDAWDVASAKEERVKSLIEDLTGYEVVGNGLGTGSTEYISGSAVENGYCKGDADLYIPQIECYVEVTGPNIAMSYELPLWIRPDKIKNAFDKIEANKGRLHVIIHVLTEKGTNNIRLRVIKIDKFFRNFFDSGAFRLINPIIRGNKETYYEIPAGHEVILSFDELIEQIKSM